jgi:hypothetical protein
MRHDLVILKWNPKADFLYEIPASFTKRAGCTSIHLVRLGLHAADRNTFSSCTK